MRKQILVSFYNIGLVAKANPQGMDDATLIRWARITADKLMLDVRLMRADIDDVNQLVIFA